jgi:hypothetical protein
MTTDNGETGQNAHQIPLGSGLRKVRGKDDGQFRAIKSRSEVMKISPHCIRAGNSRTGVRDPRGILEAMLASLSEGKVAEVVGAFGEHFTFTDHALGLEFKDKGRLIKFLQKSRELFPDTIVEVVSVLESGDYAIAEWKLAAKQRVPCGAMRPQLPISLHGVSIVQVKGERITSWSDYYDPLESSRRGLAAQYTDWTGAFRAFEE